MHNESPLNESPRPDAVCAVDGCTQPAVVTPRSPAAADVVDVRAGEIVPLCADHAEQANTPEDPPKA